MCDTLRNRLLFEIDDRDCAVNYVGNIDTVGDGVHPSVSGASAHGDGGDDGIACHRPSQEPGSWANCRPLYFGINDPLHLDRLAQSHRMWS